MWLAALWGCAAPRLAVVGPSGVNSGPFELQIESDADWVELLVDGELAELDGPVDPTDWADGMHQLTVRAGGFLRATASEVVQVQTDTHGPVVSIPVRSRAVEQGHTLAVFFRTDEEVTARAVRFLDRERPTFPVGERMWRALIGVPIRTEPGAHSVEIELTDAHGNISTSTFEVTVFAVEWVISGKLPLSKKKARVQPEGVKKMRAERDAVYATPSEAAVWGGRFEVPLVGPHTSVFGTFREYPDGKRSHHDAEDISQKPGRPIVAAEAGRVALARRQEVHGNAVLVDHGQKVISLYSHMRSFAVEEGQAVKRGDVLGYVGSTGRSTGPHLHWGVVVDEVPVDPMQWAEEAFGVEGLSFVALEASDG